MTNAEIALVQNDIFESLFTDECEDAIPDDPIRYLEIHPLKDVMCSAAEITAKIETFKANKCAGSGGSLAKVIKNVSEGIFNYLLVVFS